MSEGTLAAPRVPAVLLVGAGAAWMVKAGVILATGVQPPLLLQIGQMLCALALLVLLVGLPERPRRLVVIGAVVAGAAVVAILAASVMELVPGAAISRGEDFVFPYSALVLAGTLGIFFAMLSFGIAFRRLGAPARKSMIPLVAGLVPLPAAATGFMHIELPILIIGFAWAAAGTGIFLHPPRS